MLQQYRLGSWYTHSMCPKQVQWRRPDNISTADFLKPYVTGPGPMKFVDYFSTQLSRYGQGERGCLYIHAGVCNQLRLNLVLSTCLPSLLIPRSCPI